MQYAENKSTKHHISLVRNAEQPFVTHAERIKQNVLYVDTPKVNPNSSPNIAFGFPQISFLFFFELYVRNTPQEQ